MEGAEYMGMHGHPEVSMHTHPLSEYMQHIYKDHWEGVAELMLSSAHKLAAAGADFLICPDNTIHQVFDIVESRSPLPQFSPVEASDPPIRSARADSWRGLRSAPRFRRAWRNRASRGQAVPRPWDRCAVFPPPRASAARWLLRGRFQRRAGSAQLRQRHPEAARGLRDLEDVGDGLRDVVHVVLYLDEEAVGERRAHGARAEVCRAAGDVEEL